MDSKLHDAINRLRENCLKSPVIDSFSLETNPPVTKMAIEIISESSHIRFNKQDLDFFEHSDGFTFYWKKANELMGIINILPMLDLFSKKQNTYYPPEWGDGGVLYKFDTFEHASEFSLYTLLTVKDHDCREMWFWDEDGDKYPLTLNMSNYVLEALNFGGTFGWQFFYIDIEKLNNHKLSWANGTTISTTIEKMKKLQKTLTETFQNQDWSHLDVKIREVSSFFDLLI